MLMNWKEYKFFATWFFIALFIFSILFYGKIEFESIVSLSLVTAIFAESIYDVKNKTVDKFFYTESDPYNHVMRYFVFFAALALWLWVGYDVYNEMK